MSSKFLEATPGFEPGTTELTVRGSNRAELCGQHTNYTLLR